DPDDVARESRNVLLVSLEAGEGALERRTDLAQRPAVAGDDRLHVEGSDRVQGRARFREGGIAAEELAEHRPETVFPERIAGDEHARLRRIEHHGMGIVAGSG